MNKMQGNFWQRGAAALLLTAAAALAATGATAAEAFKLQPSEDELYGSRDLARGDYVKSAERFEMALELAGTARMMRGPALNNLCVAYTAQQKLEAAAEYCNAAVDNGRELGLALNNRGVMHIAAGDYAAALRDFEAAVTADGTPRVATGNLQLAQQRIAQLEARQDTQVAENEPAVTPDGA